MGSMCSCCRGGTGGLEEQLELSESKHKASSSLKKRPRPGKKAETEDDRARAEEARRKAGLAAQQRAEKFEKSAAGKAARKVAAELAKPSPPSNQRGEPVLKWQMG